MDVRVVVSMLMFELLGNPADPISASAMIGAAIWPWFKNWSMVPPYNIFVLLCASLPSVILEGDCTTSSEPLDNP
jgi:hypothetical protein